MTRRPAVVKPSDTMEEVRKIFEKHGFHHVPVVSENKLVGLVSYTDYLSLIRAVFDNPQDDRTNEKVLHALKVEEVMTKHLLCLNQTDTAEAALRIFKANQFHSLPVVDEQQHLVGIITTYDLMKVLEKVFMQYADAVEDPGR